jgi:CubicO group peptidase (beta-lactamase class C family)
VTALTRTIRVLGDAVDARVFPGAIVEVGSREGARATVSVGRLTYDGPSADVRADTVYDLASLTKVVATTALVHGLVARGVLALSDPVATWVPQWIGSDRRAVTVQHLLEHSSGLPGHRPYYQSLSGRDAFESAICAEPLEYAPGARSVYSDPGFMLLGFALESAAGAALDVQFDAWRRRELGEDVTLAYRPATDWAARTAPTELDAWRGRLVCGEVHDENAAALGGVAAHAGLFGTAGAVGAAARWWLAQLDPASARTLETSGASSSLAHRFVQRSRVPGSSRAMGWDTMLPTSSCGTRMSTAAFGHTGFTGTSLWIDPTPASDAGSASGRYVVLLSNRVHPSRAGDEIQRVRRAVHDAVAGDLED